MLLRRTLVALAVALGLVSVPSAAQAATYSAALTTAIADLPPPRGRPAPGPVTTTVMSGDEDAPDLSPHLRSRHAVGPVSRLPVWRVQSLASLTTTAHRAVSLSVTRVTTGLLSSRRFAIRKESKNAITLTPSTNNHPF